MSETFKFLNLMTLIVLAFMLVHLLGFELDNNVLDNKKTSYIIYCISISKLNIINQCIKKSVTTIADSWKLENIFFLNKLRTAWMTKLKCLLHILWIIAYYLSLHNHIPIENNLNWKKNCKIWIWLMENRTHLSLRIWLNLKTLSFSLTSFVFHQL